MLAPELRNFSIVREGPLYRVARVIVLDRDRERLVRLGVIIGLIGWAPLVVLSGLQTALFIGPTVTFYGSLGTHARFLLAIPLFFVAETWFDARTGEVLRDLVRARVVPVADVPGFVSMLRRAIALVDSWFVEAALVIVTMALLISGIRVDSADHRLDLAEYQRSAGVVDVGWMVVHPREHAALSVSRMAVALASGDLGVDLVANRPAGPAVGPHSP